MRSPLLIAGMIVSFAAPAVATPLASQKTPSREGAAFALAQLQPGERVRIAVPDGKILEGRFVAVRDGDLILDGPPARIPAAAVQKVWIRGRAVKLGAIIGGVAFGLFTGALGGLSGAFCESNCEGAVIQGAAVGAGGGAAAGALAGGLAGAAFPKWRRVDLTSLATRRRTPAADRTGALSFQGGWARGRDLRAGNGGLGGRLGLSAELPGGFATSLEWGQFDLGVGQVITPRGRLLHYDESVSHAGVAVTKTRDHGRLRPYALASLGRYSWHGFDALSLHPDLDYGTAVTYRSFFGASLGGGLRLRTERRLSFEMEGRWHTSLREVARPTFEGPGQHWNMVSLAAGAKVSW